MALRSGFEVPVRQWGDPETAKFGLIVFHGMTEHSGRYQRLGDWVASQEGCLIGADHVGHGDTHTGALGDLSKLGWTGLIDRNCRLVQWVLASYPQLKWTILGHSMGSFIAQEVVSKLRPSVVSIVLTGASYESKIATGLGRLVSSILAGFLGDTAKGTAVYRILYGQFNYYFRPARTLFDWLSRDGAVVDSYIADPKCGFVPPLSFFVEAFRGFYNLFSPAFFSAFPRIPILILSGSCDPVTHFAKGSQALAARYRKAGHKDVTVRSFLGLRHVILDELGNEDVYDTLKQWLSRVGSDTLKIDSN